jgi:hypothetical protein
MTIRPQQIERARVGKLGGQVYARRLNSLVVVNQTYAGIFGRNRLHDLTRSVRAASVQHQQLELDLVRAWYDRVDRCRNVALLVQRRHDDTD